MSVAEHAAAAAREDRNATGHASEHDPAAVKDRNSRCAGSSRSPADICWGSETNPTAEHLQEAERHRKMAADHRAGAQALREAEARACGGIADEDRDISPFFHGKDIERTEPLVVKSRQQGGTGEHEATVGAVVYFRPVPGLTQELFQRVINCHLARNASMGHVAAEMPYCPLVPKGVTAVVRSDGARFAVELRGQDDEAAREVLRRASLLVKR